MAPGFSPYAAPFLGEGSVISGFYSLLDHTDDFLVVNKAAGVAVQGDPHAPSLLHHLKQDLMLPHLYPVHRLDSGTSGVVVLAKTETANRALSMAFQERQVAKYYLALTAKKPSKKQGLVSGDMEKARGGSYRLMHTRQNPALTAFFSFAFEEGMRLLVVRPYTGKTHQIRVALKALSAPIIGDARYGGPPADRMYLHAWQLSFSFAGQDFTYRALPQAGLLFAREKFAELVATLAPENLRWNG